MALKPSNFATARVPTNVNSRLFQALIELSGRIDALERNPAVGTSGIKNSNIAPGAVNGTSLALNSITAGHVVAGTITGDKLDARTITSDKIAVGTITALSGVIASAAITTANIQDLAVTNAKIASISADKVDLSSATFRTGATGSRVEIDAGGLRGYNSSGVAIISLDTTTGIATFGGVVTTGASVPASTLTGFIGGGNLLIDSSFESPDPALPGSKFVNGGASFAKSSAQAFHGTKSLAVSYAASGSFCYTQAVSHHGIPVTTLRGRPVVFSAWVYKTGTGTLATDKSLRISDDFGDLAVAPMSSIPANQWTRVVLKGTPSASTTELYLVLYNPHSAGGVTVYFDGLQLELGDAATAYAPKPDEIIYGSITSLALAANSVTATAVLAGSISADKISIGVPTIVVPNGQFNAGNPADGSVPANGWNVFTGAGSPVFSIQSDPSFGRTVRVVHATAGNAVVYQPGITLPVGRHVLRGWVKTTNVVAVTGEGAAIHVEFTGTAVGTVTAPPRLLGTNGWTLQEVVINITTAGTVQIDAAIVGYNGTVTGTAEFANIHLIPPVAGTTLTPTAIDAMTITGATFRTAASGARVELTSAGLISYDASAAQTFNINAATGAVTLIGDIYAKTGLAVLDGSGSTPVEGQRVRWRTSGGTTVGYIGHTTNGGSGSLQLLSGYIGSGNANSEYVTMTAQSTNSARRAYLEMAGSPSGNSSIMALASNSSGSDFQAWLARGDGASTYVQAYSNPSVQKISSRNSSAFTVGAGATTSITITGNLPSGTTGAHMPIIALSGTNAQRLTWAWGGIGTTVDIYNPTGASISGTVYWQWISY
jgi:hypothetical protein